MDNVTEISIKQIKLDNKTLFGSAFAASFNKLMSIDAIPADPKVCLVKLKKQFIENIKVTEEAMKGMDEKNKQELMDKKVTYRFVKLEPLMVAENLSAEDMFQLECLLKEEK